MSKHLVVLAVGGAFALSMAACSRNEQAPEHGDSHEDHGPSIMEEAGEHAHAAAQPQAEPAAPAASDPVLTSYLRIHKALAGNSVEGVSAAATSLVKAAEPHRSHGGNHGEVVTSLIESAGTLQGADLAAAREGFKTLSRQMIRYRALIPQVAEQTVVIHCPMANADWLQTTPEVQNPYHGTDMPRCGSVTKQRGEG